MSLYTAEWAQPGCGDFSLTWPDVETPRNKLLGMSVRNFIDRANWARKTHCDYGPYHSQTGAWDCILKGKWTKHRNLSLPSCWLWTQCDPPWWWSCKPRPTLLPGSCPCQVFSVWFWLLFCPSAPPPHDNKNNNIHSTHVFPASICVWFTLVAASPFWDLTSPQLVLSFKFSIR